MSLILVTSGSVVPLLHVTFCFTKVSEYLGTPSKPPKSRLLSSFCVSNYADAVADAVADPDGWLWGCRTPSFLVRVAHFFKMVLVLSEADESEYVISNVELFEFQSNWPENTRHVNEPFTSFIPEEQKRQKKCTPACRFCAGSISVNSMISALFKR